MDEEGLDKYLSRFDLLSTLVSTLVVALIKGSARTASWEVSK